MSARAAGYARIAPDLVAVGVTYADTDSFARSVGPCARRSAVALRLPVGELNSYARGGWAWIGVDFANSVAMPDGRNLAFGFLIRGERRAEWATSDDDVMRPRMAEWSATAHAFGGVSA